MAGSSITNSAVEAPPAKTAPDSKDLMDVLENQSDEQLIAMQERLDKSVVALRDMLGELVSERTELNETKVKHQEMIDTFFESTNSLSIKKENISGAKLQETPLQQFQRITNKAFFKGAETVQINQNVGELKKRQLFDNEGNPVPSGTAPTTQIHSRFQMGFQSANKWFAEKASDAKSGASQLWSNIQEQRASMQAQKPDSLPVPPRTLSESEELDRYSAQYFGMEHPTGSPTSLNDDAAVLIEVQVELQDGRNVPLQVRAADRACVAVEHFLTANALDTTYNVPLTEYLTKVEDDAEHFPIYTEMKLANILVQ